MKVSLVRHKLIKLEVNYGNNSGIYLEMILHLKTRNENKTNTVCEKLDFGSPNFLPPLAIYSIILSEVVYTL